jgi:hypothetical protein
MGCSGYSDVFEAAERLLGLGPRATRERVRVGRALRQLPRVERALEHGELSFARAREITRVARAESEATWLELGRQLPTRELERRVAEAGGRSGDGASKPSKSAASGPDTVRMVLDLPIGDWITVQKALRTVRDRVGGVLTDADALTALAQAILTDGKTAGEAGDGGRPPAIHDPAGSVRRVPSGLVPHVPTSVSPPTPANDEDCDNDEARVDDGAHASEASTGSFDGVGVPNGDPVGTCDARANGAPTGSLGGVDLRNGDPAGARDAPAGDAALRDAALLLQHFPDRSRWCVDQLCDATGLTVQAVRVALLTLELQGAIRREDWAHYALRAA